MTPARAAVLVLVLCAALAGCGSSEQAQQLCASLDSDRQTDPLLLAHQAYGYDPNSGDDVIEVLNEENEGIVENCTRHADVARYLRAIRDFDASREAAPTPPAGYGGR